MQRGHCRLFFSFIVLMVLGCTFEPVRMSSISTQIGSCLVDLENGLIQTSVRDGSTESSVSFGYNEFKIDMPPQMRMDYNPLSDIFKNVGITGRFPNGTGYFVRIDSGFPWYVGVTDTVVADQKLVSCFMSDSPIPMGVCELKSLSFDKITVTSPPCLYFQQHWELQMLGMPIWKERAVLIGLNLMEQFSYILFDNQQGQVEFGRRDTLFDPGSDAWQSYSISLLDDPQGQYRLQVNIPIAGEDLHAWFDTGNPGELELASGIWAKVASRFEADPPEKGTIQYWQFGNVECEKILVHNLMVGQLERKNLELIVLPDGKPFYEEYASIGMGFFKDDVLVLDFNRKLLWVKQR
jgi:hypothetical protein